jgi:hypothetical protein
LLIAALAIAPTQLMKDTTISTLVAIVLAQTVSHAAVVYDGFDYSVGGTLAGNTDWTALNSGTAPSIAAGNLAVSGLPPSTGQKVQFASGNIQEALGALNTFNTDTVYFSLAFQLTSVPTGTGTYSFALSTGNTNYGATVWLQADGTDGFDVGLANRSNSTPTYSTTKLFLNTTYFLVSAYSFVSGAGNDTSSLWINPDSSTFGQAIAPAPSLTAIGGSDLAQINQFLLRGALGSPAGEIDELRIGTSWSGVTAVPEPTALLGLLGGIGVLSLFRQRARRY